MRIVICDDENSVAEAIKQELDIFFGNRQIPVQLMCYHSGDALLAAMKEHSFDLLFMDIQLGEEDGVELVRSIREQNADLPVIFLTNMEDRVLDGYEVKAFYFLFKKEFRQKLPGIMERFLKEYSETEKLVIQNHGSVQYVMLKEVCFVESDKRNVSIHTTLGTFCDGGPISAFRRQLPEWLFVEAYHCVYVNLDHISRVDIDSIVLDNGETVPLSRRNRKKVMTAVMSRMSVL